MDNPVSRRDDDGVAILTTDNPPVNATSLAVRDGLKRAVQEADADASIGAIVIACAGRTFFAGADMQEFGKPPQRPILFELCDAIEASNTPVVAAIHGTALGGGFEIALASHYRIAQNSARVGLPEVSLGLTPGAGGTQRLPRLIGLQAALDIIASGRQVSAREALNLGAIDAIARGDLLNEAVAMAREAIGKPFRRSGDLPVPNFESAAVRTQIEAIEKRARGQVSPVEAARLVLKSPNVSTATGVAAEREAFLRLMDSEQSKALRHIFAAERAARKVPGIDPNTALNVSRVGVVGAGTMGTGISVALANAGYDVTIIEQDEAAADKGYQSIKKIWEHNLARRHITQKVMDARLELIHPGFDSQALANCDLVIEAVFDDLQIKQDLFRTLSGIVRPECILATNTSYLNPDEIARDVTNPQRVVGMHFFAPANIMRLLEVVRAADTAPEVLATALAVGQKLGKICVVAGVCTGFIGNRTYASYRKQSEFMLEEGALPHEIDKAMRDFGLPMGPFRAFDLSGLDISWALRKRQAATRDPNARYCAIPDTLCEMGRFGQKAEVGYYRYQDGKASSDPAVWQIIEQASRDKGLERRSFEAAEIQLRLVSAMANEGGKIIEEGIALRESDIDVVFTNGYGWPKWRGGPMFQARAMGLKRVLEEVRKMEARDGSEFSVSRWLVEEAAKAD